MNRVDGKIAMVSGAGRGIGAETARLLAEAGAAVAVLARGPGRAEAVASEIRDAGGEAVGLVHDATSDADWARAADETVARFGRLDILVNNAGVFLRKRLEEQTLEDWRFVMGPNVEGVFLGMKHGFRAMKAGKETPSGAIVNMSAIGGFIGTPFTTAYGASKGAVRLMTKCAALEAAQLGYAIRVNSIHPALVETDMAEAALTQFAALNTGGDMEAARATVRQAHPIGRFASAREVALGILFLASDDSSYMTGAELLVDGGYTAR